MCGVWFSLGFENISASVIDSVAHRGPNGRGWNEFQSPQGPVIMAHRRLAIVDLSEDGHQPISSEDGRYWLTYNGEIYNYLELRQELETLGYLFRTQTDTEVLLKSYLHWKESCLDHFNGMFAFVIWDDEEKKIFAARDRFGVKPLYYYKQDDKIAFASEIKQFKNLSNFVNILNKDLALEYLQKGYCDHWEETLFQNVFQLLPGHFGTLTQHQPDLHIEHWYNLKDKITHLKINDREAKKNFIRLFEDAIRLRLRSDVPVGACLSGGVDSTSIVSMIRKVTSPKFPIHTFSAVFPGHKVDETSYIDELASSKKLASHKNYPTLEKFLEEIDRILYHQDLPFAGTSIFAQWITFKNAQQNNVTVLLDGQGADESLIGYPSMLYGLLFDYAKRFKLVKIVNIINWFSQFHHTSLKTVFLGGLQQRYPTLYQKLLKLRKASSLPSYINKKFFADCRNNQAKPLKTIEDISLSHFSYNFQTLLRYEDRNSMASSCESRLPFLDYRLVEFLMSLPIEQKFKNAHTKWILREAMQGINIPSILKRKDKIGFTTPESEWSAIMKGKLESFITCSQIKNDMFIYEQFKHIKEAELFKILIFLRWKEINKL